jgi:hypothetical protein
MKFSQCSIEDIKLPLPSTHRSHVNYTIPEPLQRRKQQLRAEHRPDLDGRLQGSLPLPLPKEREIQVLPSCLQDYCMAVRLNLNMTPVSKGRGWCPPTYSSQLATLCRAGTAEPPPGHSLETHNSSPPSPASTDKRSEASRPRPEWLPAGSGGRPTRLQVLFIQPRRRAPTSCC